MVMEKNKHELNETKKPFPRKDPQTEESEKSKRKAVSINLFFSSPGPIAITWHPSSVVCRL